MVFRSRFILSNGTPPGRVYLHTAGLHEVFNNGDAVVYLAILEWIGEGKATLHPSEDDLTKVLTSVDDRIQKVEERFHKGSLSQETYISDIANLQEAREYLKELLQTLNAKKPMGPKQHSLTENFDDHV